MQGYDVVQFLESAAGEVGYAAADAIQNGYAEPEMIKSRDTFIAQGGDPRYFGDVYADQVYDDPNFQQDLIGDFICSEPNREEILDQIERNYPVAVVALRR